MNFPVKAMDAVCTSYPHPTAHGTMENKNVGTRETAYMCMCYSSEDAPSEDSDELSSEVPSEEEDVSEEVLEESEEEDEDEEAAEEAGSSKV